MSAESPRVDALLESVADGATVDWDALEASADPRERRLLRHLRVIAGVAEVHRTMPAEAPVPPAVTPLMHTVGVGQALPRWGHLLLLEKVGEGAFGEVYRARDAWLDREVALKILKPDVARRVPATRIVTEARALARVRHPNVVTVHGADMHDGRVGLWMEFVHGRTLAQIVATQGPFSAAEAAIIGQELCRALAAVHAAGLIHRDVKAQNVMRESGGRLVLMDFGAGHTPLYLAPELLQDDDATVASDVYALGVLLYYLVTGNYPVRGSSLENLREAHARGERRRLHDVRSDLPEGFVVVVERALHPDAKERFASAREMQDGLARASVVSTGHPTPIATRVAPTDGVRWRRWMTATALAVTAAGVVTWMAFDRWSADPPAPSAPPINLIAVLPFENVSNDPADAHLASAVSMELTTRLAEIGGLRVVPWTFTRRFVGGASTLEDVVRATRADAVVEGSVQALAPRVSAQARRRVRVRVHLYRAASGALLWSEAYERDVSDFLVLQSNIAEAVARQVNALITRREQARLSQQGRRVEPEVLEDYLRGREALEERQDVSAARALFERATARDPSFAEAHARLALVYALESAYVGAVPPRIALPRAIKAAERAIAVDPQMPEAYAARAFARMALAYEWASAETDLKRALQLGPESPVVHDEYSNYLTYHARHDEAIAAARRAEERAPLSAAASRKVAWALYMARSYHESIGQLQRTLEIAPGYAPAMTLLGRAYALVGRHDEAIRLLKEAGAPYQPKLALVYAIAGRRQEAVQLLEALTSRAAGVPVVPYELCVIHAALGQRDAALAYLRRGLEEHDPSLAFILVDPMFDPIRDSPQFAAVVREMNLKP